MKLPFCAVSIVFYPVKHGIFGNVHVNEHFSTESVEQDSLTRILFIYICTFIQYIPSFQLLQSLEESMTFARQIFINLNVKILKSSHIEFSLVLFRHYIHTQHTIQCNLMVREANQDYSVILLSFKQASRNTVFRQTGKQSAVFHI